MKGIKLLNVNSNEIIMLEALLEKFNSTNPHEVLLNMSNNILSNIEEKKRIYKNEFEDENFKEVSNNLKALVKGEISELKIKDEPLCRSCHFGSNENKCSKEKEIKNYWGEDDGLQVIDNLQKNKIFACMFYELKKIFEIQNIKDEGNMSLIELKITQGNETQTVIYGKNVLDFLIFRYGKESFINLHSFKEQLQKIGF